VDEMGRGGGRSIMILDDFIASLDLTQVLLGVTEHQRDASTIRTKLYRKIEISNHTIHDGGGDARDS